MRLDFCVPSGKLVKETLLFAVTWRNHVLSCRHMSLNTSTRVLHFLETIVFRCSVLRAWGDMRLWPQFTGCLPLPCLVSVLEALAVREPESFSVARG